MADFAAIEHHAAAIGGNQADYHVKAGGFARAVGPSSPTTSPLSISSEKFFTTWRFLKLFCRCWTFSRLCGVVMGKASDDDVGMTI